MDVIIALIHFFSHQLGFFEWDDYYLCLKWRKTNYSLPQCITKRRYQQQKMCVVQSTNSHRESRNQLCRSLCNELWQSLNFKPRKLIMFDFIFISWMIYFFLTSSDDREKENLHTKTPLGFKAFSSAMFSLHCSRSYGKRGLQ